MIVFHACPISHQGSNFHYRNKVGRENHYNRKLADHNAEWAPFPFISVIFSSPMKTVQDMSIYPWHRALDSISPGAILR